MRTTSTTSSHMNVVILFLPDCCIPIRYDICYILLFILSPTSEQNGRHHWSVGSLPPSRKLCFRRCLSVCLSVSNFAQKNFRTDLHELFREGWEWANEQVIKFWWRSGSPSGYRDCFPDSSLSGDTEMDNGHSFILIRQMAALVRRALAEVCTVPVLLVNYALRNHQ